MFSPDVRTSREDEVIAAAPEAPSPGDLTPLMVDDSGKPPGYSGYPTVPLEPSPEEAYPLAVTGQG